MNEKELAAQLQATKDDADEWGDPESGEEGATPSGLRGTGPKRRLAAMVSVRLSPEELEAVQARAAARGESVSGYLRGLVLRDMTVAKVQFLKSVYVTAGEPYVWKIVGSSVVRDGGEVINAGPPRS